MRVFVTGGSGFVGEHLCRALVKEHQVCALVRKSSKLEALTELGVNLCYGDILDKESYRRQLEQADLIYHLAGHIAYDYRENEQMQKVNVEGTQNLLSLSPANSKFIFLSSIVTIGASTSPNELLDENSPYNLSHLKLGYYETKRQAENLVLNAFKNRGLKALSLNPSSIYGPGDAKKGTRKMQVKCAQGKLRFYPSGGVSVVDLDDVVECLLAAPYKGTWGERYILNGENLKICDLFSMISLTAMASPPTIGIPKSILLGLGYMDQWLGKTLGKKGIITLDRAYSAVLYHWYRNEKASKQFNIKFKRAQVAVEKSVKWLRENDYL